MAVKEEEPPEGGPVRFTLTDFSTFMAPQDIEALHDDLALLSRLRRDAVAASDQIRII